MKILDVFDIQDVPTTNLVYQFGFSPYWIAYFIQQRLWTDYKTQKVFDWTYREIVETPVPINSPTVERVCLFMENNLTEDELRDIRDIPVVYMPCP